jgi:hypothetical protein
VPYSQEREHHPTLPRPQVLTRAEYAKRAKLLYQPTPAPVAANALFLVVCVFNMLVIYEDIGPATLAARVALLAVVNGVFLSGGFLVAQEAARRRASRLGLLCPSCGHYPLGASRLRYTTKGQVERILERGCCDRCGNDLFHAK